MACGQCELQGVDRQVWLCLTRVGSGRNLAQRGPEWLGERDLRACRSPQPFLEDIRPASQTVAAQVRVPVFPRARILPFAMVTAYQGREKRGLLGSGSCSEAQGRCACARGQRRKRERRHKRRAHPQTAPCACGEPAELTVTEVIRGCLPWSASAPGPSPGSSVSLCGRHWV